MGLLPIETRVRRELSPRVIERCSMIVGWREWVALPELGVPLIKAKVDTGARTSCLHARDVTIFMRKKQRWVRFTIYPTQRSTRSAVVCAAPLVDERWVRSSNGRAQLRPVILTQVDVGGECWDIELTLTNRDVMGFRMLLGRQAARGRMLVDPGASYLTRKVRPRPKRKRLAKKKPTTKRAKTTKTERQRPTARPQVTHKTGRRRKPSTLQRR